MKVILDKKLITEKGIKDFDIDPVNKEVVAVGKKLYIITIDIEDNVKIREFGGKLKNIEAIRFIKEENQLFVSNAFFILTIYGNIYKYDGGKHKIVKDIFSMERTLEYINFTTNGKIIYLLDNILHSYNPNSGKTIRKDLSNENNENKGKYKIYINNENIVLKYRALHFQENTISIFDENLDEIFNIKTLKNHIYSSIFDLQYIAGTEDGEIEIWDVITKELYNSIKISDYRISYIEKMKENYFLGLSSGEFVITDNKFKIIKTMNLHKDDILKIRANDENIFTLGLDSNVLSLRILKDEDLDAERERFLREFNIHNDYFEFFTYDRVEKVNNFLKEFKLKNVNYAPKDEFIFRVLSDSIKSRKVCILAKEPYLQNNEATGLAFEMEKKSWADPEINSTLKNMLKLIYKTYMGTLKDISFIREDIESRKFQILPPNKLFKYWKESGVLLLNTIFTVSEVRSNEHIKFWTPFTQELLEFISEKNKEIIYFLWGKDTQVFEKNIISGEKILHNHPASSGNNEKEKDFLNSDSFEKTRNIINWTGYEAENNNTLF